MSPTAPRRRSILTRRLSPLRVAAVFATAASILVAVPVAAFADEDRRPVPQDESVPVTEVKPSGAPVVAPEGVWDGPTGVDLAEVSADAVTAVGGNLTIADQTIADELGVDGLVLNLTGATGETPVTVDYSTFADAYGAGWSGRLNLYRLPDCALTTPDLPECRTLSPLPDASNDTDDMTVTATTEAGSGSGAVLALAADPASGTGDYTATKLSPAGSWAAGGNSGAFTYNYPLRMPPGVAGPTPSVDLSYSSQAIDGRTTATNNQAEDVGDGWSVPDHFIERTYIGCSADQDDVDGKTPNNTDIKTGDKCWAGDIMTMSLNGSGGSLVKDDTDGDWRVSSDGNWKVNKLADSALNAYDDNGEYWQIITPDGTQYFFGSQPATSKSTWTAPVFGNHPDEPCHATAYKDSSCRQAYRWMLDKVIDVHGNLITYTYETENGYYGRNVDASDRVWFTRGGQLKSIAYGGRTGQTPAVKVDFAYGDRCLKTSCWTGSDPVTDNWPDTPWDANCSSAPCTTQLSPAFFSTKRLTTITTGVYNGSTYSPVDEWKLAHEFKELGPSEGSALWLKSIQHSGKSGGTIELPATTFEGVAAFNRVDIGASPRILRYRIQSINTESGGTLQVTYSDPDCDPADMPAADANATRCYPVWWTSPFVSEPSKTWFIKYVVTGLAEIDHTGGQVPIYHSYDYSTAGGGTTQLWAYDDSELTEKKRRTYGQWRGYPLVTETTGAGGDNPLKTATRYYRGMDEQPRLDGTKRDVKIPDSESASNTVEDHRALAGRVRESISYNGTAITEASTYEYWTKLTASRDRTGTTDLEAFLTGEELVKTRTALTDTDWRKTQITTTYDGEGNPLTVEDLGDTRTADDDLCTTNTYVHSDAAWLRGYLSRAETKAATCATTATAANIISDAYSFYDNATSATATPTKGLVTRVDELDKWESARSYMTTSKTGYDVHGRATSTTDALNRTTTTTYTPTTGGPVTATKTTNPAGHSTTSNLNPAWGQATTVVDANTKTTTIAYDALGRITKVWQPGRATTLGPNTEFIYTTRADDVSAVTTKKLNANEGYVTTVELYDSLMRKIQTQTDTAVGGRLINTSTYDYRGLETATSGPNWNNEATPTTALVSVTRDKDMALREKSYDGAGRVTLETFTSKTVELNRTTTSYGGSTEDWRVAVIPPTGDTPKATLTDARGNTTKLYQYLSDGTTGDAYLTSYTYTPRGEVKTVTDTENNVWSYAYDYRGRKTKSVDPDAGTSTTTYDDAGQISVTKDGRGVELFYTYDALGRPKTKKDAAGKNLATWDYDTVMLGQQTSSTSYDADGNAYTSATTSYDDAYRPKKQTVTLPSTTGSLAGTYTKNYSYYPDGSLKATDFPLTGDLARETLTYRYDNLGHQTILGSALGVYVDQASYSAYGELVGRNLGSATGLQVVQTNVYEDGTRRLLDASTSRSRAIDEPDTVPTNVASTNYAYDPAGNITSITDAPEGQPGQAERQCFQYDRLRRLTEAWTQTASDACAETPALGLLAGPAPYWTTWALDAIGNRHTQTEHAVGGNTVSTYTPGAAADQPHTLKNVKTVAADGSTTADGYIYDDAGNLDTRTLDGPDTAEDFTFDATGKLTHVAKTTAGTADGATSYVYDADGNQLLRTVDDGDPTLLDKTTANIFGQEATWTHGTTSVTTTRYYQHSGTTIAARDNTGLTWLANDHHGTTMWAIAAGTMLVLPTRRRDPYGNPRGTQPQTWPGDTGYVGGTENDSTGLTTLGARQYEPTTGRFISRDAVIDFNDPQQVNGYAYSNNSPLTFSDASGLRTCGNDDCSQWETVDSGGRRNNNIIQGKRDKENREKRDRERGNEPLIPPGWGVDPNAQLGPDAEDDGCWTWSWLCGTAIEDAGDTIAQGIANYDGQEINSGGLCVSVGFQIFAGVGFDGCLVVTADGVALTTRESAGVGLAGGGDATIGLMLSSSETFSDLAGNDVYGSMAVGEGVVVEAEGAFSASGDFTTTISGGFGAEVCPAGSCAFEVGTGTTEVTPLWWW